MFDTILSSASCLLGVVSECDLDGAGGATPPAQLIISTVAAGSVALIIVVWNDAIKALLKGSLGNLVAATLLAIGAIVEPSVVLAGLAVGILVAASLCWKWIRGNSLNLGRGRRIALARLVLPSASAAYVLGVLMMAVFDHVYPGPSPPDKTVAFFIPTRMVNTSLYDLPLDDRQKILVDIDLKRKTRISGPLADLDIEFHPTYPPDKQLQLRHDYGQTTSSQLDSWLCQNEALRHLCKKVDIALEESARVERTSGQSRRLNVRADVRLRKDDEGRFDRVTTGNPVFANGTMANTNELTLILAVRLAAKLLNELKLSLLTPEQQSRVWRDFSQDLQDFMDDFLEHASNLPPDAQKDARDALAKAEQCEDAACTLEVAAALEKLLKPPGHDENQLTIATDRAKTDSGQ